MLAMGLALTTAAVLFELALAVRFRAMLRALRRRPVAGIAVSVTVSWALGSVFGASGMIVMFAAITTSVVTGVIYASGVLELLLDARERIGSTRLCKRSR